MNPILNQMMSTMFGNNPFMALFRTIRAAQNPNAMLQNETRNNPQLQQVYNMINQSGMSAKDLYYSTCKQRGIDPNIIINDLNSQK